MIKVLIADNQTLTREGMMAVLSTVKDINVIGKASNAVELEQMTLELKPDVIIIDHNYGQHFNIKDILNIHTQFDFAHVMILSNGTDENEILDIINLGIKNYAGKNCSGEELINCIYATAKGGQFFCEGTLKTLVSNKEPSAKDNHIALLSSRETEIVYLIAEGMTNKEIAERLFLSIHTIKTHRKNIIKKLGFTFKNTAELASVIQAHKSFI